MKLLTVEIYNNNYAISNLVGAILMVVIAIVGITALYVYLNDIAEKNTIDEIIEIEFIEDEKNNTLIINQINSSEVTWEDFKIEYQNNISYLKLITTHSSYYFVGKSWYTDKDLTHAVSLSNNYVENGDYFYINGTGSMSISHKISNKLLGTWDFD